MTPSQPPRFCKSITVNIPPGFKFQSGMIYPPGPYDLPPEIASEVTRIDRKYFVRKNYEVLNNG